MNLKMESVFAGFVRRRIAGVFLLALLSSALWQPVAANDGKRLSLSEAVTIALQKNPNLNAARYATESAGQGTRKARSDLFPKADLQFGYSRLDPGTVRRGNVFVGIARALVDTFNTGNPADIRPGAYTNTFSTVFQVVQPIYNGGANWAALSLARSQATSTEFTLEDTRQQVIFETRIRYLSALQAQELLALARKTLESSERHLQSASKMLEVGMRNRTEVLRWDVQKASDEGRLVEAENNLEIAFAALKHVMGVSQAEEFGIIAVSFPADSLEKTIADPAAFRDRHPRVQAVEAVVEAQRAGVRLASAAFQPKVNFVYQLGWEQNNTLSLDSFSYWNAGISLQMPIFHSFSNVANLQRSRADLHRMEELRTESERQVTFEVIQARRSLESARKRIQIAGKATEQARENLESLNNTYEVGIAANIDVLDGEVILRRAQTELINSRYDFLIARAQLERAMGIVEE